MLSYIGFFSRDDNIKLIKIPVTMFQPCILRPTQSLYLQKVKNNWEE
jgi:hypothetical protein